MPQLDFNLVFENFLITLLFFFTFYLFFSCFFLRRVFSGIFLKNQLFNLAFFKDNLFKENKIASNKDYIFVAKIVATKIGKMQ